MAMTLVIVFGGHELRLIPLYAVGVFLSFTLSQTGMVLHWRRRGGAGWQGRALMNVLGAMSTAVVLAVFIVAKFREGAWVVVLLIPAGVSIFLMMGHHYRKQAA